MDTKITIPILLLSILNLKDPKLVERKLTTMERQLTLNEVEHKIIEGIRNTIQVDTTPTVEYIEERYDYYFNDIILESDMYSLDAIDSAIANTRVEQLRRDLSKELIELGGKASTMTPKELKEKLTELHTNALIESKSATPENSLKKRKDAYADYTEHLDGLSLVEGQIEKQAGKAVPGTVISILAGTGEYKTVFSMNVAYINAMAGKNMLYLMFESTDMKLEQKLVVLHNAKTVKDRSLLIKSNWVREKKLSPTQQKHFNEKQNEMIDNFNDHLIVWDTSDIRIDTFIDMADTFRKADKMFVEEQVIMLTVSL